MPRLNFVTKDGHLYIRTADVLRWMDELAERHRERAKEYRAKSAKSDPRGYNTKLAEQEEEVAQSISIHAADFALTLQRVR